MGRNMNIELMDAVRSTENIMKRSRMDTGIPRGNGRIMRAISENDGLPQAQLAELLSVRPQSLTRTLAGLQEKGYIIRKRSESDSRVVTVSITEEGRKYYERLRASREKRAEDIFSCLETEEKKELLRMLDKVIRSFGEDEA